MEELKFKLLEFVRQDFDTGQQGLVGETLPAPDTPLHQGRVGYHLRTGKHDLTLYDWQRFMDFADKHK